jgi:hypothetical protein
MSNAMTRLRMIDRALLLSHQLAMIQLHKRKIAEAMATLHGARRLRRIRDDIADMRASQAGTAS